MSFSSFSLRCICPPSLPSLYSKDFLSPMNCTARNPLPSGFWLALPVDQKVGRKKEQDNSALSHSFCATSLWLQLGHSSSLVLTFNGGSGDSFHPLALRYYGKSWLPTLASLWLPQYPLSAL